MSDEPVYFTTLEEDYARMLATCAHGEGPQGSCTYQRNAAQVALRNAAFAARAVLTQTGEREQWLAAMDEWNVRAERHLRLLRLVKL